MNLKEMFLKLEDAANLYYNSSEVCMTDEEFDTLKDKYEKLSGKKFFVGSKPNVSNTIEVSHSYKNLAGTLEKVNSLEELNKWISSKKLNQKFLKASLKFDGHSVIIEFNEKGKIDKALTRGRDGEGKDLTGFFKNLLNGLSVDFFQGKKFAIAFEAVISWEDLDKLNNEFKLSYKNPRSAISGIIKEDGVELAKYLRLIPLKFHFHESNNTIITRKQEIEYLTLIASLDKIFYEFFTIDSYGYTIERLYPIFNTVDCPDIFKVFMVDGLVIETFDDNARKALGYSEISPNFSVALKFPYQTKSTKLVDVEWYTEGNSAVYTPVAIIEPVNINGFTYKNVSLANYARFTSMKLRKGTKLMFSLRNEVLGYVEKMVDQEATPKGKLFNPPTTCKECNEDLYTDDVFLFCINDNCKLTQIGAIQTFVEKMKVKGIKREILDKLYDSKIVTSIKDIVTIKSKYDDIKNLEGFGNKSASLIVESVEKALFKRKVYDYEILGSLNIPLISRGRAKIIFSGCDVKLKDLLDLDKEKVKALSSEMQKIENIKNAITDSLFEGIEEKKDLLEYLTLNIPFSNFKDDTSSFSSGVKFNVCVTGNLKTMGRDEFKNELEKLGHKMVSSVTKKTSYLVTNNKDSNTVKNKNAIALGVPVINEEEALELFGIKNANQYTVVNIEDVF